MDTKQPGKNKARGILNAQKNQAAKTRETAFEPFCEKGSRKTVTQKAWGKNANATAFCLSQFEQGSNAPFLAKGQKRVAKTWETAFEPFCEKGSRKTVTQKAWGKNGLRQQLFCSAKTWEKPFGFFASLPFLPKGKKGPFKPKGLNRVFSKRLKTWEKNAVLKVSFKTAFLFILFKASGW